MGFGFPAQPIKGTSSQRLPLYQGEQIRRLVVAGTKFWAVSSWMVWFCYLSCGQGGGEEEEEEEEGRRRTLQHLGSLALHVIGNNRGHRGRVALFHLHVIPAINPSDQLELFSIDMFTREVRI